MNYEKVAEKWLKMCSDHRGEQIISLSELLGTAVNEALEMAGQRPVVIGAKPLCLDCHSAGITNCSHFDNCDGKWVYVAAPEPELTAEFFLHQREIEGPTMLSVEQIKALLNEFAARRAGKCASGMRLSDEAGIKWLQGETEDDPMQD